jgi:hypothetical protein
MCEVSGNPGVGKSTFCYALSALIAKELDSNVAIADLEDRIDEDFLRIVMGNVGFQGTVNNAEGDLDGEKIYAMLDLLEKGDKQKNTYSVGILDSIGAISPVSEVEGNPEDANMGRRAFLANKVSRKAIKLSNVKRVPYVVLATNHVHSVIGGRGTLTPGGKGKEYLSTTRIRLSVKEQFDDGSTLIGGKVDKNSFGYSKRSFYVFNVAGWGIHPGLTALQDCVLLGIATNSRVVKLGDKSYGYLKQIIAQADDQELFQPFLDALKASSGGEVISEESEE